MPPLGRTLSERYSTGAPGTWMGWRRPDLPERARGGRQRHCHRCAHTQRQAARPARQRQGGHRGQRRQDGGGRDAVSVRSLASRYWHIAVVTVVAFAVTAPSLGNGFTYDDIPIIAENQRISAG